DIQCAGSDTRPPMLDRTDFASWQQRIRLYYRGKDNGGNILKSIDEGPYQMGTIRETLAESTEGAPQFCPKRSRVYSNLTSKEKDRYNAYIRATNILLQGLPKDIYTLINHYTDAKDIWDNVKMLLEGSRLTKEDREFAKLIHDMRNIKMTMSRLQLNSKFVNNMLPKWGRFVMDVKLNRGLRDSNYDQLYAYLKQHKTHAKENKMILEHFSQPTVDPLALMSNVSNPQHYSPSSSASSSTQVPPPLADSRHIARNCTQPKRPLNSKHFKDKMLLMQAQENGVALDVEQLMTVMPLILMWMRLPLHKPCSNPSSADPVTDEARPSYDSNILSEVPDHEHYQDAACLQHEGHVTYDSVQPDHVVDSHADYTSDSSMILYDQYVKDNEVPVVHSDASSVPTDAFMMIYNDMQKSYADVRRKPLEFEVGDRVMLKVSTGKGVKCLADEELFILLDEVKIDDKLHFIEEPVEIMDQEVKQLKQSRIPIVKVRWNLKLMTVMPLILMWMRLPLHKPCSNPSSADPVTDEARPSYDSNILSEYVKDNEVPVVHSDASSVPTDAFMMIYNDMCESYD
nr:putative reverse transcriptase domain-containing protein [Tanacetum cinerariifolium]